MISVTLNVLLTAISSFKLSVVLITLIKNGIKNKIVHPKNSINDLLESVV